MEGPLHGAEEGGRSTRQQGSLSKYKNHQILRQNKAFKLKGALLKCFIGRFLFTWAQRNGREIAPFAHPWIYFCSCCLTFKETHNF